MGTPNGWKEYERLLIVSDENGKIKNLQLNWIVYNYGA